jgi:hypothetical protein
MKKLLLIFVMFFSISAAATDTLRYSDGKIEAVYKRYKYYRHYYHNGQIGFYHTDETWLRKGKTIRYDSLGNVTSQGKTKIYGNKHGKWSYYSNGHKDSTIRYKYGVPKKELRTSKGRRVRCILTYGYGAWGYRLCDTARDKYRIEYISVAGCVINTRIQVKSGFHNFFVNTAMCLRYGPAWRNKIDTACGDLEKI